MVTLITKIIEDKDIKDIFGLKYNIYDELVFQQLDNFEHSNNKNDNNWIMSYSKDKSIYSKPTLLDIHQITIDDINNYEYSQECLKYLEENVGLNRSRTLWTMIKYNMYKDWSQEMIDFIDKLEIEKELNSKLNINP